jgi:hypothetical protein
METTVDVFLKDEGDFVTIGFQTERAKIVLYNDNVLSKLYYKIEGSIYSKGSSIPKVDFPMEAIKYIKNFLEANELTYEEC